MLVLVLVSRRHGDLDDHMGKVGELRVLFLHIEYVRVGVYVIQSVRISIPNVQ